MQVTNRLPHADPLPVDAIALHIGIHKTGTTALQSALRDARLELSEHGILYPGRKGAQHDAAEGVLGQPRGWLGRGGDPPDPRAFHRMAKQARRHEGRVIISSETFCQSDDSQAALVVEGLGQDRTHVIVALRNLGNLLPSTWQQYLKWGRTMTYERWLEAMFDPEYDGRITPTFWRRNDHGALVRRWADLVGADHMTVLVLEHVDPDALFIAFAELLDLPARVLTERKDLSTNRSMTAGEAEFLRRLNSSVKDELDWPRYRDLVKRNVVSGILDGRRPRADEPRLHTPDWALEAAAVRGARDAALIRTMDVRVIGDLDALAARGRSTPPVPQQALDFLPTDDVVKVVAHQILTLSAHRPPNPDPSSNPSLPSSSRFGRAARRVLRRSAPGEASVAGRSWPRRWTRRRRGWG